MITHEGNVALFKEVAARPHTIVPDALQKNPKPPSIEGVAGERVLTDGEDVTLEPMTAVERKIVHVRLHEVDGIETASVGTEPNRSVVIRRPVAATGCRPV